MNSDYYSNVNTPDSTYIIINTTAIDYNNSVKCKAQGH